MLEIIVMAEEKNKLIPFSEELETVVQEDADRCRRSFVRQVEAVLMAHYGIGDVEVNKPTLEILGEILPQGEKKIKVLPNAVQAGRKKAS